ncbi:cellulose biosynthesis protein BcsQ [Undibacterium sp. CY21W]|uniref:cellulose biosynthesis protein BcsQ n=1 Tax=Undibacterium sp. CY21W TaxID=2762293 RepID=UPI00164BF400|nr:cellulose biosynthesis protein BcsQ [Undibacterium sp. CY21W]MBC3927611.1 cellulose synthase operon protein YhjQ [Undibacterium sp. CY21W]
MRIVAVISPKGGVGKTTVTANLAASLARMGAKVVVLDLDPQNALRLHFGIPYEDASGIAIRNLADDRWSHVLYQSTYGVDFLPYGTVEEDQRAIFEDAVRKNPDWLLSHLQNLFLEPETVVLIDTPPGPSIYLQQVLSVAHIGLVVLKPDAASYSTIPSIESLIQYYTAGRKDFLGYCYVLNQMDASRQLCRDVHGMLRTTLGDKFVPSTIHKDEAVSEALACQMPVSYYAQHSSATHDVQQLAAWLQENFGLID